MTSVFKDVTKTQTVTRRECVSTTCDKCGDAVPDYDEHYSEFEVAVHASTRTTYPEDMGDNPHTGWRVHDLCKACAQALRQLLIDNGYNVVDHDGSDLREWCQY